MTVLAFQKPDKVIMVDSDESFGKFEFRPLEPGYGITVGNALRRILLSSLEGYAITTVKIEGVEHEFSTITGVIEDVTEIILNLKQIRFKNQIDDVDDEKIHRRELREFDLVAETIQGREIRNASCICHVGRNEIRRDHLHLGLAMPVHPLRHGPGVAPEQQNSDHPGNAERQHLSRNDLSSVFLAVNHVGSNLSLVQFKNNR